jgi:hypothetical protein
MLKLTTAIPVENITSATPPFKEFKALDAHPKWHRISSNAHHFHTILTKDFENLMVGERFPKIFKYVFCERIGF